MHSRIPLLKGAVNPSADSIMILTLYKDCEVYDFKSIGTGNLNSIVRMPSSSSKQSQYSSVWEALFIADDWLNMVYKKFRVNPLLMGNRKDFECVMHSTNWRKDQPYLMLILRDWSGDSQYTKDELLRSLCDGELHETVYELESGIRLDVRDVVTSEEFPIYNSKLFSNGLDLSYVFWEDGKATIGSIGREQMAIPRSIPGLQHPMSWNDINSHRPFGRITTDDKPLRKDWANANHPVDEEDMCIDFGLRLDLPNGRPFNQRFVRSGSEVCGFWRNRIIDWKDDDADGVGHLDMIVFEDAFQGFNYAQGQDTVPRL